MFRSSRLAWLVVAVMTSGCYSGLDLDDGWTGATGLTAPSSGASAPGSSGGEDSDSGGDPTEGGGSMSGAMTSDGSGVTTADATTEPAGTTGEPDDTTGLDPTTGGDPGTTTVGTTNDPSTTTTNGTDPSTTSTTGVPPNPDVPDGVPYCDPAKTWDPAWKQLEEDILVQVNQARAQGANCGAEGNFGATGPLTMNPNLRCAARMHSKDMSDRNFFDHTNPDNESPWDRMDKAGYGNYSNAGENIAAGSPDAAGTMEQWMGSDGHCANIMNPDFQELGVGYHTGGQWGHLWTQVFGAK